MNKKFDNVLNEFEKALRFSEIPFCIVPSSLDFIAYYFSDDDISKVMTLMAAIKMYEFTSIDITSSYLSMIFKGEHFTGRQIIISSK